MQKSKLVRLLALFLSIGVVATACSSDDSDDAPAAPATTAAATTAAPATTAEVEVVQGGSLLDAVKARGTLNCGVSGSAVAFSETQADGSVTGFDADYCRAVAAAVLGDANAVMFMALTAAERFTAVQTGDVDVLMRNSTWT
ncbi:MAG TPA: amino acid ABC transporter substrate-binding protein, partial [Acidimicrobiaceae bacterium]|nr:amino acid ABC transporter substrate-binding protein [Acidimicrobiaceae bacterium]